MNVWYGILIAFHGGIYHICRLIYTQKKLRRENLFNPILEDSSKEEPGGTPIHRPEELGVQASGASGRRLLVQTPLI